MVEGQPVSIQSPARKQLGHGDCGVRPDSIDSRWYAKGGADFFDERGFFELGSLMAGKNSASSRSACSIAARAFEGREGSRGAD